MRGTVVRDAISVLAAQVEAKLRLTATADVVLATQDSPRNASEGQVGDHLLQLLFVAWRSELAQLGDAEAGELLVPAGERLL